MRELAALARALAATIVATISAFAAVAAIRSGFPWWPVHAVVAAVFWWASISPAPINQQPEDV